MALTLNRLCGFESRNLVAGGEVENNTSLTITTTCPTDSGEWACGLLNGSATCDIEVAKHTADAGTGWIMGFACKFENTLTSHNNLFQVTDPSNSTWFLNFGIDSSDQWQITDGQAAGGQTSSTETATTSQWYYIEIHGVINNSSTTVKVFVDDIEVISATHNLTSGVAGSPVSLRFLGNSSFQTIVDDVYLMTGASAATDRLGPIKIVPYKTSNTTTTPDDGGDVLDVGTWEGAMLPPGYTTTATAEYTSSGGRAGAVDCDNTGTWPNNGGSMRGPLNDSAHSGDTIVAIGGFWNMQRSGGGGSAHYGLLGNPTDGTTRSWDFDPTTSSVIYPWCTTSTTFMPTLSEYLQVGFETTGGQDFTCDHFLGYVAYAYDTAVPRDVTCTTEVLELDGTTYPATVTTASPRNVVCSSEVLTLTENQADTGIDRTINTVANAEQLAFTSTATVVRDPDVRKITGGPSKSKRWKALPWSDWMLDGHTGIYSTHDAGTINNMLDGDLGTSYNVTSNSVPWIQGVAGTLGPESSTTAVPAGIKIRLYVSGTAGATMTTWVGWDYGNQRDLGTTLERYELESLGNAEVTGGGGGNWSEWKDVNLAYNNWDDGGATDLTSPLTWNAIQEKFVFYSHNDTGTINCHAIQIMVQETEPANLISGYVDASLGWEDEKGAWRDQANSWDGSAATFASTAKGTSTTWGDGYFQAAGNTLTQGGAEDEVQSVWMRARLRGQYDATNIDLSAILYPYHPDYYDWSGENVKFPVYNPSSPTYYQNQGFAGPDDTSGVYFWEFPATSNTAFWSPWYKIDFTSLDADWVDKKWKTWAEIQKMGFRLYRGLDADGATLEIGKVEYVVLAEPPNANRGGGKVKKGRGVNCTTEVIELDGTTYPATVTKNVRRDVGGTTETLALDGTTYPATVARDRVATQATPEELLLTESAATVSFSSPRDVTCTTEALALDGTTYPAIVGRNRGVAADPETLALTENASTVNRTREAAAAPEVVTLVENASVVTRNRVASSTTEVVTLLSNSAVVAANRGVISASESTLVDSSGGSVVFGRSVFGIPASIELSATLAVVNRTRNTTATPEVIQLLENVAVIAASRGVVAPVESTLLDSSGGAVDAGRLVTGTPEAATLSTNNAVVNRTRGTAATPEVIQLLENVAVVAADRGVIAPVESLILTGTPADVTKLRPVLGNTEVLTLVGNDATVDTSSGSVPRNVTCTTEAVELSATPAGVNGRRVVGASVALSTIVENASSLNRTRGTAATSEILLLAQNAANIEANRGVIGSTEIIEAVGTAATVETSTSRIVTGVTEQIALTESAANLNMTRGVGSAVEVLQLSSGPAAIVKLRNVLSSSESIALGVFPSGINASRHVGGVSEVLESTSPAATVFRGVNRVVTGTTEALVLAEAAATITNGRLIVGLTADSLLATPNSLMNRSRQVGSIVETLQLTANNAGIAKTRSGAQPGSLIWSHPNLEEYVLVDGRMIRL